MAITHDTDGNPYDDKILQLVQLCNNRNRRSIRDAVPFICTYDSILHPNCNPTDYDVYIDFMLKCFKNKNLSDDIAHDLLYLIFSDSLYSHDCLTDEIIYNNIGLRMNDILRVIDPAFADSFNINEIQWRLINHYNDNLRILLILDDANIRIDYDYIYQRAEDVYSNDTEHYNYADFELYNVFNLTPADVKSLGKAIILLTDVIKNTDNNADNENKRFFACNLLDLLLTSNKYSIYSMPRYVNDKFSKTLINMLTNKDESFTLDLTTLSKQSNIMRSFEWLSADFNELMKNPSGTLERIGANRYVNKDYSKMRVFIIFMAYYQHVSKKAGNDYGKYGLMNILDYIKQLNDGYPDEYAYENLKVNQDKTDANRAES